MARLRAAINPDAAGGASRPPTTNSRENSLLTMRQSRPGEPSVRLVGRRLARVQARRVGKGAERAVPTRCARFALRTLRAEHCPLHVGFERSVKSLRAGRAQVIVVLEIDCVVYLGAAH